MASLGFIGSGDKKSSLLAKMGGMIDAARRDGQTPKRWIVSDTFALQMLAVVYPARSQRVAYTLAGDWAWMGLPVIVNDTALHECELEVE